MSCQHLHYDMELSKDLPKIHYKCKDCGAETVEDGRRMSLFSTNIDWDK